MSDERFAWMASEREELLHYLNVMRDAVVRVSEGLPLRAIVTHMIEETARHAGHADILRERIDGATAL